MAKTPQPEDLFTRIKELERRLAALERARPLASARVSRGSFDVRTPTGQLVARIGEITLTSGTKAYGLITYGLNGKARFWAWDNTSGAGYVALYDESGNDIVSSDTVSGQGISRPYIPLPSVPYSEVLTPTVLTTSGTFTNLFRIHSLKQHPKIRVQCVVKLDAGTTGEIQLAQGGVAISDVTTLTDGLFAYVNLIGTPTGGHLIDVQIDVQARRTGGAGNVRVLLCYALGRQS